MLAPGGGPEFAPVATFANHVQEAWDEYWAYFRSLPGGGPEAIAAACPALVYQAVMTRADWVCAQSPGVLSERTLTRIGDWKGRCLHRLGGRAQPLWEALDEYQRTGQWHASMDLLRSEQAHLGADIGRHFGAAGIFIGLALGALAASVDDERHAREALQQLYSSYHEWWRDLVRDLDRKVVPSIQRDLHPPTIGDRVLRLGCLLGAVTALGGAAYATYSFVFDDGEPTAPPAHAQPAPPPPPTAVGLWRAPNGASYEAVAVGDLVELRVSGAEAEAEGAYLTGEPLVVLHPSTEPHRFAVHHRVRPSLPSRLVWTPEGREGCLLVATSVDGAPLEARLADDVLTVELARLEATRRDLELRRRDVIGCRHLSELAMTRGEVHLDRVEIPQ